MIQPIDGLVGGVLSQELKNGAFAIEFFDGEKNYLRGVEFFPGEAMLALMDVYELATNNDTSATIDESTQATLPAMERAFEFYSTYYNTEDTEIHFNIWQLQALQSIMMQLTPYVIQNEARYRDMSWKYVKRYANQSH